jgi:hypothetical protein
MPTTLAQAQTAALQVLDDENSLYYTSAELTQWINDACSDIAQSAECLQALDTIQTSANQQQYVMPGDIIRMHKVEWSQLPSGPGSQPFTYTLKALGITEMDSVWGNSHSLPAAWPRAYSFWQQPPNLLMILYPVPAQSGNLNLWYYRLPKTLVNSTDILDIPEGWEPAVREYCIYMAHRKARSPEQSAALQAYQTKLQELISRTRNFHDNASQIFTGSTDIPMWLYDTSPW